MKRWSRILLLILLIAILVTAINAFQPSDKEPIPEGSESLQHPGRMTYVIDVEDVNGNYEGNFLRVRLVGDVDGLQVGGCHIWEQDPNYMTIDNAVADVNDPNTTLYGSFFITRVWKHKEYEIGYWIFDVADNNDCRWGYIDSKDRRRPKAKKMDKYQK